MAVLVALVLVTGLRLPQWLGTPLQVLGALFGVLGLWAAFRHRGQEG
jgi:hypothetical protein